MAKTTKVYLLNVPIERDYKHTLYFENKEKQFEYFVSQKIKSYEDLSYQRKDKFIRVPAHFEDVLTCNYVLYQNPDFNNKWFYAFITNIEYVQPDRTDIHIETDCIQTWMFDISIKQCFVEREHVIDDTPGIHTFPEQLETGDYIANKKTPYQKLLYKSYVVGATVDLSNQANKFPNVEGEVYNGIYSGVRYFYFTNASTIGGILKAVADEGKSDSIVSIFMTPKEFMVDIDGMPLVDGAIVPLSIAPIDSEWSTSRYVNDEFTQEKISKPNTINGYEPKNNKLFTYPYSYMLMSNNAGASAIYKYELFKNPIESNVCDFRINFALTPGCSIRLLPLDYNGIEQNNEEGLNGGKLPACSWTTDIYTNWLTQNAINYPVQIASGAVQAVSGIVSGAASGAVVGAAAGPVGSLAGGIGGGISGAAGGVLSIASTVGEKYAHSLQPPQAEGNLNSGDVTFSNGDLTFTAYEMSIKEEYAKVIDNYFSMFGYKVNRVKVPNKNHRESYWYTKTIDANIVGNIPQQDLQIIKNAYDNGITFWRDAYSMGNYTDNPII